LQIARPSTARAMLESWLDQIAKRRLGVNTGTTQIQRRTPAQYSA
jgi:hypothetical protein